MYLQGIAEVNLEFEDAFLEIASSLKLLRNLLIALISCQSWKSFMRRWMKVQLMLLDIGAHRLDKTSKAATYILKVGCDSYVLLLWFTLPLLPELQIFYSDSNIFRFFILMQSICRIAEECIPSCAENCALAIGAFCLVYISQTMSYSSDIVLH